MTVYQTMLPEWNTKRGDLNPVKARQNSTISFFFQLENCKINQFKVKLLHVPSCSYFLKARASLQ